MEKEKAECLVQLEMAEMNAVGEQKRPKPKQEKQRRWKMGGEEEMMEEKKRRKG